MSGRRTELGIRGNSFGTVETCNRQQEHDYHEAGLLFHLTFKSLRQFSHLQCDILVLLTFKLFPFMMEVYVFGVVSAACILPLLLHDIVTKMHTQTHIVSFRLSHFSHFLSFLFIACSKLSAKIGRDSVVLSHCCLKSL